MLVKQLHWLLVSVQVFDASTDGSLNVKVSSIGDGTEATFMLSASGELQAPALKTRELALEVGVGWGGELWGCLSFLLPRFTLPPVCLQTTGGLAVCDSSRLGATAADPVGVWLSHSLLVFFASPSHPPSLLLSLPHHPHSLDVSTCVHLSGIPDDVGVWGRGLGAFGC